MFDTTLFLYSMHYAIRGAETLPAMQIADLVNQELINHEALVITAAPGAGKSTLLPLTILKGLDSSQPQSKGKILMLEPRRLAARQIAERLAWMLGEPVGQTVGYRVRFENKISSRTRIEVLTEGILTRMLIDDPTLEGVSLVIFDEFHERSLSSDLALALTRESHNIIRPDLRLVIMSATIDATSLCQLLHAHHIDCPGRLYPVKVQHVTVEPPMQTVQEIAEAVSHQVRLSLLHHEGDILAFLPGEAEIRRCQELLKGASLSERDIANGINILQVFPLYGQLSTQQQQQAIAPSALHERKVVLSTPIAETSLTIEGVRVVVDSGLCRTLVFDSQRGLSHLQTVRISHDMANQRSGRAGRVAPGVCFRLWSIATHHRLPPCRQPEILEADLAPMVLDVAAWGEGQVDQIAWLTPPPSAHVAQARQLLHLLRALDDQDLITSHGRQLASLPCHPRIAQMMLLSDSAVLKSLASDISALLEEKDPLAGDPHAGIDLNIRLEKLRQMRSRLHYDRGWDRIARIAEQYCSMVHVRPDCQSIEPHLVGRLLAAAYPERVAQALPEGVGNYRLSSGEQIVIDANDALNAYDWIAIASLNVSKENSGRVFLASPVLLDELRPIAWTRDHVAWDSRRLCIVAQHEERLGCLLIASRPLSNPSRDIINKVLCEAALRDGLSMFNFDDAVHNMQHRIATVAEWHPELNLPDLSTDTFLRRAYEWLPLYVGRATSADELRRLDLCPILWGMLDYTQQQAVDRLAPTHIQVPTGSRIRVEYRQGPELPILRVRLQECFGLTDTPLVDNGQRPVLMELLSPGFKSVQLTQDLKNFWQNTYFEIRKELRRRYPKHSWPDNPLQAQAVRGVVRK